MASGANTKATLPDEAARAASSDEAAARTDWGGGADALDGSASCGEGDEGLDQLAIRMAAFVAQAKTALAAVPDVLGLRGRDA